MHQPQICDSVGHHSECCKKRRVPNTYSMLFEKEVRRLGVANQPRNLWHHNLELPGHAWPSSFSQIKDQLKPQQIST